MSKPAICLWCLIQLKVFFVCFKFQLRTWHVLMWCHVVYSNRKKKNNKRNAPPNKKWHSWKKLSKIKVWNWVLWLGSSHEFDDLTPNANTKDSGRHSDLSLLNWMDLTSLSKKQTNLQWIDSGRCSSINLIAARQVAQKGGKGACCLWWTGLLTTDDVPDYYLFSSLIRWQTGIDHHDSQSSTVSLGPKYPPNKTSSICVLFVLLC